MMKDEIDPYLNSRKRLPMSEPRSDAGYPDCMEFMQRAINDTEGWSMTFTKEGRAKNFRMRCYAARRRWLKMNMQRTFEHIEDESQRERERTKTPWDGLVILIEEVKDGWKVMALHDSNALIEAQIISQGSISEERKAKETPMSPKESS